MTIEYGAVVWDELHGELGELNFSILPSSPLCVNTEGPDDVPMHDDVLYIVPASGNMESAPELSLF